MPQRRRRVRSTARSVDPAKVALGALPLVVPIGLVCAAVVLAGVRGGPMAFGFGLAIGLLGGFGGIATAVGALSAQVVPVRWPIVWQLVGALMAVPPIGLAGRAVALVASDSSRALQIGLLPTRVEYGFAWVVCELALVTSVAALVWGRGLADPPSEPADPTTSPAA